MRTNLRTVLGFFLIAAGALMVLDNVYYFDFSYYLFSLPTFFIVVGVVVYINSQNKLVSGILITFGAITFVTQFFGYEFGDLFSDAWPLILILAGVFILLKRNDHRNKFHKGNWNEGGTYAEVEDGKFEVAALFSSIRRKFTSQQLIKGSATAIFGSTGLDFTEAAPESETITLELVSLFGGNNLRLPQSWSVIDNTMSIFGGASDKRIFTVKPEEVSTTLVLKGLNLFGGLKITN